MHTTISTNLALALADYDGKTVAVLEDISRSYGKDSALLEDSVRLVRAVDTNVSTGAAGRPLVHVTTGR